MTDDPKTNTTNSIPVEGADTDTEIAHDIPVKTQIRAAPTAASSEVGQVKKMDAILQQVSKDVKNSDKKPKKIPKLQKPKVNKPKTDNQQAIAKYLPIAIAIIVGLILCGASIYAYSKGQPAPAHVYNPKDTQPQSTSQSSAAISQESITADTLSAYSADLQSQINNLGLTQFKTDELNDSALGL